MPKSHFIFSHFDVLCSLFQFVVLTRIDDNFWKLFESDKQVFVGFFVSRIFGFSLYTLSFRLFRVAHFLFLTLVSHM